MSGDATPRVARVIKTAQFRVYLPEARVAPMPESDGGGGFGAHDRTYAISALSMSDDAIAAEWRGDRFLCPRTPRLRMLEGVLAVRNAYGRLGADGVVPERVARAAREELEQIQQEWPTARAHILTSAWHVPLRWFVPFVTSSRELVCDGDRLRIRYRSDQRVAMANLDTYRNLQGPKLSAEQLGATVVSSFPSVRGTLGHIVAAEWVWLRRWLGEFPTAAMVELDYGSVADLFGEEELVMDESASEVRAALDALNRGTVPSAIRHYHRVVSHWSDLAAISSKN